MEVRRHGYVPRALLAQELECGPSVSSRQETACGAHDDAEVEGEVLDLPPLTSEDEEKCSRGETRTHNLAAPQEPFLYQYPSAKSQEDGGID